MAKKNTDLQTAYVTQFDKNGKPISYAYAPAKTTTTKKSTKKTKKSTTKSKKQTFDKNTKDPYTGKLVTEFNDAYIKDLQDIASKMDKKSAEEFVDKYLGDKERIQKSLDDGTFYNAETDPLAVAYRNDYTRGGQQALKDALAKYAGASGNISSYALATAQNAYNDYMADLTSKVLELRNQAEQSARDNLKGYEGMTSQAQDIFNMNNANQVNALGNAYDMYKNLSDTDYKRMVTDPNQNYWYGVNQWNTERGLNNDMEKFYEELALKKEQLDNQFAQTSAGRSGGGYGGGGAGGAGDGGYYGGDNTSADYSAVGHATKTVYKPTVTGTTIGEYFGKEKTGNSYVENSGDKWKEKYK